MSALGPHARRTPVPDFWVAETQRRREEFFWLFDATWVHAEARAARVHPKKFPLCVSASLRPITRAIALLALLALLTVACGQREESATMETTDLEPAKDALTK